MASISKRLTAAGEARYDVRYRAGGRAVEETFKRRQDAENRVRQVEAERLTGPVADPRRGREKLADFAERWLDTRLVKGKPLAPMTKQGYLGLLARNIEATIGQYELARITPSVVRDWYAKVTVTAGRDQAAKSYRLLRAILIHDLRHHAAATLTARMPGITTKELMARIGHASPRAALIYQHATEQRDREIAAYLDEVIPEP